MSRIQPIGVSPPGLIGLHQGLPHVTLAGALSVWRRRACAISLGRCNTSAYLLHLSCGESSRSMRRQVAYTDFLKLYGGSNIADYWASEGPESAEAERARPLRLWPFHYPIIEPVVDKEASANHDAGPRLGAYIDMIL